MSILKLKKNRVWRTYTGGAMIDAMYGDSEPKDSHYPEVWIASTVEAVNPDKRPFEGLSLVEDTDVALKSLIESDPSRYLGSNHVEHIGETMGILVKFLDSSERLTIQVHPDKANARRLFQSEYGKTEAWYVMDGRILDGQEPHIYYGFKEGISKALWKELFLQQDVDGMLEWMHKIPVSKGDVFLIHGGVPHAIGAGCMILEIQEPTDYTIRIEKKTPSGYEIPDRLCHQGLGFQRMFECFDYTGYNPEGIIRKGKLADGHSKEPEQTLIGYEDTKCFSLVRHMIDCRMKLESTDSFYVLIVTDGAGQISDMEETFDVKKGDQLFVSADTDDVILDSVDGMEIIRCCPPIA